MTSNSDPAGAGKSAGRALSIEGTKPRLRTALSGLASIAADRLVAACRGGGAAAGYAGGGGGQPAGAGNQPSSSRGPVVVARKLSGIGAVLVNRSGKTIYSPRQEAHGKILCTSSCLGFWSVAVKPGTRLRAPRGVNGVLGTIHRTDDGVTELTLDGTPLYTFRLDQGPGQVHGNNFSDAFGGTSFTWQAVSASGTASKSTQSAKPGGGYSYPATGPTETELLAPRASSS